jgi:hypothetical protein
MSFVVLNLCRGRCHATTEPIRNLFASWRIIFTSNGEPSMKSLFTTATACLLLASSFAMHAEAATKKKDSAMAQREAACQQQAKKKYSAVHFLKRRAFVKECMSQRA